MYKVFTQKEHILFAPETWVDSPIPVLRDEYLMIDGKIKKTQVMTPLAVIRIFTEAIANSVDNFSRSSLAGVDPGSLVVDMNRKTISISNGGLPVPLIMHQEYGRLNPEIIFGTMYSSSNYTEIRNFIGRNGLGAKLVNIFSSRFVAEVFDHINHKHWVGVWINNMDTFQSSNIEDWNGTASLVRVNYDLDFPRFGMTEYPDEVFAIISRLCADVSFTNKVPVTFNGVNMNYTNIHDYSNLYFSGDRPKSIIYYQWPEGVIPIVEKNGTERPPNGYTLPLVELIALDTPDSSFNISFVNSLMTPDGGIHVENTVQALSNSIVNFVNEGSKRKKSNQLESTNQENQLPKTKKVKAIKKTKEEKEKDKEKPKINKSDVRPHVSIIVAVRLPNPSFNSQTKTLLRGPDFKLVIPPHILDKMNKWDTALRLKATLNAKGYKLLKKTDGTKKRHVFDCKVNDCNFAGTKNSDKAILAITEGKSASQYVTVLRRCIPNGGDIIGSLPIRGKLINSINNTPEDLANNTEIAEIKQALGLREGVDYRLQEARNTMRYGSVFIMADQDDDGRHIKGLILLYFTTFFPSLIACGAILEYMTPFLRLSKGKQKIPIYFKREFEEWERANPNWSVDGWEAKYCKGLASSSPAEIISDAATQKIIRMILDNDAMNYMNLGFNCNFSGMRKKWISSYDPSRIPQISNGHQTITSYINDELIEYSIASLLRHLPSISDGLKPSGRKLLYNSFIKFGRKLTTNKPQNVNVFCASTIEKTRYHHGDSLPGVLAGMAAEYVGSNNLPFFNPDSLLGSRVEGGQDAGAARYTSFTAEWWLPLIFRPEDDPLLNPAIDEGHEIEPEYYLPIIPMLLVNGARAMATGYSTFVPCHHPLDIVNAIKQKISGANITPFKPWYRGFKGQIIIHDKRSEPKTTSSFFQIEDDQDQVGDELDPLSSSTIVVEGEKYEVEEKKKVGKYSMETRGVYEITKEGITVTELPIGVWTKTYTDWLTSLLKRGLLKDVRNMCDDLKVHLELNNFLGEMTEIPLYKTTIMIDDKKLRLRKSYGLTNMTALDTQKHPIKFDSVVAMIEYFYNYRLPFYEKRRMYKINQLQTEIDKINGRILFISSVINGNLKLWKRRDEITDDGEEETSGLRRQTLRDEQDIFRDMDSLGIARNILKDTKTNAFTTRVLNKLIGERDKLLQEKYTFEIDTAGNMWSRNLEEFETKYLQKYKDDRYVKTNMLICKDFGL